MTVPATPRLGLLLPTRGVFLSDPTVPSSNLQPPTPSSLRQVIELAERAEAAGCHSVWVGDSLTAKPRLDALVTLSALAVRTERVRIGTAVLLGALYQPVLLARAAASLDLLSNGRLVLAMGVGGAFNPAQQREWAAAGVDPRHRAGRLEETVELLPRLWSGQPVSFSGRHFTLDQVTLEPRPLQRPSVPIWLACHTHTGSEAQFRRAARLADGIISITDSPQDFSQVWERVQAHAHEYGRDSQAFQRAFYLTVNLDPDRGRAQQEANAFVEQYYGRNWWGERWGPYGDPAAVIDRIHAYVEAGAQHVIVRFAAFDQARQMDLFEQHVAPALIDS